MQSLTKKALVLSGGSIKGAFQAGAIKAVLEKDFIPDFIYGISVGSLNGTFVANEVGKQTLASKLDWKTIGTSLINFWQKNIKKPENVIIRRPLLKNVWKILTGKFDGLLDTSPIHNLARSTISLSAIRKSPVKIKVGAVNIMDGKIIYADPSYPDFIDYVLASTAIPILMPAVKIGGNQGFPYFDGGLRDVAPLKKAIQEGATEIVCILCQSKELGGASFNYQNIISLSERFTDIMINEIVNNDIEWALYANQFLPTDGTPMTDGPFAGFRRIDIKVIRPQLPILLDLENFTQADIADLIDSGYQVAVETLK